MGVDRLDMGLQSGLDVPDGGGQADYRALRRFPHCTSSKGFGGGEPVIAGARLKGTQPMSLS